MKTLAKLLVVGLSALLFAVAPAAANHGPAPSNTHCASQPIAAEAACLSNWAAAFSVWYAVEIAEFNWVGWAINALFEAIGPAVATAVCAVFEEPLIRAASCL